MARFFALLSAVLLAACSAAQGGAPAPKADMGRVRDLAGILTPAEEARLTERLDEAQRLYGPHVGIVTVPSLDGKPIEDASLDYARQWGLGDKHRNDGLMIMVAPNDRRVRIEVGSGLEGSFNDVFCKHVIDTAMIEHFSQGHYNRGLAAALDMMIGKMRDVPTLPANDNAPLPAREAA
ncbi:MAG: TPM domain-containing protein [Croceibacterium sp.]